jgi:arylsulfatase A-like enzyme
LPSLASVHTGLAPKVHGAVAKQSRLPSWVVTIAERMSAAGYATAAVVSKPYLHAAGSSMGQGFEIYDRVESNRSDTTALVEERALRRLRELGDRPFFIWIHYLDPHWPYQPPQGYIRAGTPIARFMNESVNVREIRAGDRAFTAEQMAWLETLYGTEVKVVDDSLGRLLDQLRKDELFDGALVVLTSDHGEEFWEHGRFEHGHSMYEELLHVPLMIKLPGSRESRAGPGVVSAPVAITSVYPTILELCSLEVDAPSLSATSLVPLLEAPGAPPGWSAAPLVARFPMYYAPQEAVRIGNLKYIRHPATGHEELYDLKADPGEANSLVAAAGEALSRARAALAASAERSEALRAALRSGDEPEARTLTDDEKAQLRSLGYIE